MVRFRGAAIGVMMAAGLFGAGDASAADPPAKAAAPAAKAAPRAAKPAAVGEEVAILETSRGQMVVEFWEKDAPKTVANFKKLAREKFFNGTGFHRILKGFMVQAGDPKSKNPNATDLGTGDPGYKIPDEFNARNHVKGVLSMANSGTPNSAGSQFFIMHGAAPHLDGSYTAFGRLIKGMDVLDAIANSPTGPNPMMPGEKSRPLEWTTMKSVTIVPRASLAAAKVAKPAQPAGQSAMKAGVAAGGGMPTTAMENKSPTQAVGQAKTAPDTTKAAPDTTHSH